MTQEEAGSDRSVQGDNVPLALSTVASGCASKLTAGDKKNSYRTRGILFLEEMIKQILAWTNKKYL